MMSAKLIEQLRRFKTLGLSARFDMNPTMNYGQDAYALGGDFQRYMADMSECVKELASEVLAALPSSLASETRLTGDLVTDVIGILESKPDSVAEWVWWEAGPDGGFRVGPRDKGCVAIVFTIEEARELCKTVNTAMRALLAERGELALKLAGAECFIEEQRKKGNIK